MNSSKDYVEIFLSILTILCFCVLFFVVLIQVISRFLPTVSFLWTEELARVLFIFGTVFSGPIAYKHGEFIIVDFFIANIQNPFATILVYCTKSILLMLFAIVFFYGFFFTRLGIDQMSPTLQIPMAIPYGSISFSSLFFIYYIIIGFWKKGSIVTETTGDTKA